MRVYKFTGLYQSGLWISPAYVQVNDKGIVKNITNGEPYVKVPIEEVKGYALPGFQNAHSHAFQYAMAGLAETHRHIKADDFWAWRDAMYSLATKITPDQMEAVATMLYTEMLRHGYTAVAEFHYLHHDENGQPYSNPIEMSERLIAAANNAGIRITLIPVFYQKGGFGKEATETQKRFILNSSDDYLSFLDKVKKSCENNIYANTVAGIHSLRAANAEDIVNVVNNTVNTPLHIHIAEQKKEVDECLVYLGKRPVQWLLDNVEVTKRFHLVHATHVTEDEVTGMAMASANVILCPSTEGNLGDGLFPLFQFHTIGGNWSIGTDSHVGLNPFEELRLLDYGQRLTTNKRSIYYNPMITDSGHFALEQSIINGRASMDNIETAFFKIGRPFDALIIDSENHLIKSTSPENMMSTILYCTDVSINIATIVNGEWIINKQRHRDQTKINNDFIKAIKDLGER